MSRHFKHLAWSSPERYAKIFSTPTDAPVVPYPEDWDDTGSYREVIKACPFKPGDVIWDMPSGGSGPVRALVVYVAPEWREHRGENICRLKVARMTKGGTWAKTYNSIYPGDVQRGYEAAKVPA